MIAAAAASCERASRTANAATAEARPRYRNVWFFAARCSPRRPACYARGVESPRPWSLDDAIREAAAMKAEARRVRADARAACEWAKLAAENARRAVVQARRRWGARVS